MLTVCVCVGGGGGRGCFEIVLTRKLEDLAIMIGGGGGQKVSTV